MERLYHPWTEGFFKRLALNGMKQIAHQFLYGVRVDEHTLHLFRSIIIRLKPHVADSKFIGLIHIGMRHVNASAKDSRFSEYDVFYPGLYLSHNELQTLKPNGIHYSCAVRKMANQPTLASFAKGLETQELSTQLNIRHITIYLSDGINAATVYILIREIIQQVLKGNDIKFLSQQRSALRTYSGQIFNVAC